MHFELFKKNNRIHNDYNDNDNVDSPSQPRTLTLNINARAPRLQPAALAR